MLFRSIIHPKTQETIEGVEPHIPEKEIAGEIKKDPGSAKFVSVSFGYDHEKKRWDFSKKTREKYPEFIAHIEKNLKVGDKPFLDHVNETWEAPRKGYHPPSISGMTADSEYLKAAHKDRGKKFIQIGRAHV